MMTSHLNAKNRNILIVDDDKEMQSLLSDYLAAMGHQTRTFSSAVDALKYFESDASPVVDLIISDIRMPELNGIDFVAKLKTSHPQIPVILITAFGSLESAIEAIRRGAFDYIVKPFKLGEISVTVERALEFNRLKTDNSVLRKQIQKNYGLNDLIGKSSSMKEVFDLVNRVSGANANVLIMGESGTGKEMVARAIHNNGHRKDHPFIAINCTAIPESLLESELFGHAKGSFTGAQQRKKGLFEEAEGGTLFLDEIGDMDIALQSKLLRVLQERKIKAVGDNHYKDIDVRIVAATHKDLKSAIKQGLFREDLYYRLSVIPILIPPLRHRKEDIPLLADFFLKKFTASNHSRVQGFSKAAVEKLMNARWDGNVRELENAIERAVVLSRGEVIEASDLEVQEVVGSADQFFGMATQDYPTVEELEKRYIQVVLNKTGNKKDKTAQILGINRRTLYRKEREYGLVNSDGSEENGDRNEAND